MNTTDETPAIISPKRYKCERCGHEEIKKTNHYGPTWSLGHYATCPKCPPWAKYPEFGGNTTWLCVETPPTQQGEPTSFSAWLEANGDSIEPLDRTESAAQWFDEKEEHEKDLEHESQQDYESGQLAGNPAEYGDGSPE